MKRTMISGFLTLLFLGGLLLAQSSAVVAGKNATIPPGQPPVINQTRVDLVEIRYYEGEALIHYNEVWATNKPKDNIRGTAYVWVERIPSKNLFRGRYAICYGSGTDVPGICEATTYSSWIRGEERNGVWIIRQSNLVATLGPKQGNVKLDEGRRTITMKLKLKQPVSIPEPIQPLPVTE